MAFGLGSRVGAASVKLVVDDGDFHRDLARDRTTFNRTATGMEHDANRLGRGALAGAGAFHSLGRSIAFASGTFLGAAGFTALVRTSVGAASDLHEQINKVDVVFRGSQKSVLDWSETTAKGLGIARGQALGFAATFGNLLVPMGIARAKAGEMSVQFVKLAADLASFNNADPSDVLRALQSGLAGQVRPLRQYGIFLDQTRIKAEALRLGLLKGNVDLDKVKVVTEQVSIAQAKYNQALKDFGPGTTQVASAHVALEKAQAAVAKATAGTTNQLTQEQKALATTSIIMRDSRDAQGDFARTSGGLANQQRILKAEITDMEEKLGTALLPTVLKIVKHMTDWLGKTKNQKTVQHDLNVVLDDAGVFLGVVKDATEKMTPIVRDAVKAVGGLRHAFEILLGLAIVAKMRGIAIAIGLTSGTGMVGSARRATVAVKNLRLSLATLYAANIIGGLGTTLGLLRSIGIAGGIAATVIGTAAAASKIFGGPARGSQYSDLTIHHANGTTEQVVNVGNAPAKVKINGVWYYRYRDTGDYFPKGYGGTKTGTTATQDANDRKGITPGGTTGQTGVVGTAIQASRSAGAGGTGFHLPGEASPYDCSAFVAAVFAKSGIHLPGAPRSTTYSIAGGGRKVAKNDVLPGDLLLFDISGDTQPAPNHVGIFVGGGSMVHDHGAHGGVSYQGVPWGALWGVRCYIASHKHGVVSGGGSQPRPSSTAPASSSDTTGGLTVGQRPKRPIDAPDVPLVLQEKLARAQLTKSLDDDLKALTDIEDYLVRRIAKTKNIKKRVALLKELGSVRRQIASIDEKLPKVQHGFIQVGGPGPGLGITTPETPVAKPGQTTVNIPGIGPVLVGTEQAPTLSQIRDTIVDVYNKIKAAQSRRAAKVKALQKLLKVKKPNAKQRASVRRLQRGITALDKIIADLKADLGQYIGAANDLAAEMAADEEKNAGEAESGGGDAGVPAEATAAAVTDLPVGLSYQVAQGQYAGDYGLTVGGLRSEEALLTARLASTTDLGQRIDLMNAISGVRDQLAGAATSISPDLQLAQAQARLTASPLDDRALLQKIEDIAEARLKEARTIGEQIALTNELADLKSQLNEQQGEENSQLIAYLNARREIARTFTSNVLSPALGGSQISIINYNQQTPDDPHIWSQQVQFELQALVS